MVVMITSEEYQELVIKAYKYDEAQELERCTAKNKIEKTKCEGKHCKDKKETDITIEAEKLEGDKAKEFIKIINEIIEEDK